MSDWCPENDAAYQAEMAALHRGTFEQTMHRKVASLRAALDAAEIQTAKAVERALTAEAVIREGAATIKRLREALEKVETYGFECEAGMLVNCQQWIDAKELLK